MNSLLLSQNGDIYCFESNGCETQITPKKLEINKNKFIDISSHYIYNISIALSMNGIYYVWGKCEKEMIKETEFKSFDDIFDHFEGITFRTLNSQQIKKAEIEPVQQHKYEKILSQSPAKQREYDGLVMPTTNNPIHQQLSALSLSTHEQNELIEQ
jgi:hypothetical protein